MSDTSANNKRIAKNTLYMYIRMIVMMVISLFTTRITFNILGVDNYGIYNIVGSIIVFFTFINQALTTETRRYITAEIAQGNEDSRQILFDLSLCAHGVFAIIIFIFAESAGIFLLNNTLNIPEDWVVATNIVYQITVLTALWNVFQIRFDKDIAALHKYRTLNETPY